MSKTIFRCYSKADFRRTGINFTSLITEDDDYTPDYPYTAIPIPTDLQAPDKVPFFVAEQQQWVDMSDDAEVQLAQKQAADLESAKQDATEAKATVTAQAATIASLTKQLTEATDAIVELAQATLPSSDAETTTKQEVAQ